MWRTWQCLKEETDDREVTFDTVSDAFENAYATASYVRKKGEKRWDVEQRVIRSKVKVGTFKGHEYFTVRNHRSTGRSQTCEAMEIPRSKATFWVDSVNVGFWVQGQGQNFNPYVFHSELEKFMVIPVHINGGTLPRGAFVQEVWKLGNILRYSPVLAGEYSFMWRF